MKFKTGVDCLQIGNIKKMYVFIRRKKFAIFAYSDICRLFSGDEFSIRIEGNLFEWAYLWKSHSNKFAFRPSGLSRKLKTYSTAFL